METGTPMMNGQEDEMEIDEMTHTDLIRERNREYADAIERLSQARILLARTKALLTLNKAQLERGRSVSWDPTDQRIVDDITGFLDDGLFGNRQETLRRDKEAERLRFYSARLAERYRCNGSNAFPTH